MFTVFVPESALSVIESFVLEADYNKIEFCVPEAVNNSNTVVSIIKIKWSFLESARVNNKTAFGVLCRLSCC